MLFLDGVSVEGRPGAPPRFQWVRAPTFAQLTRLADTIARRVGRCLQRHGLLEAEYDDPVDAAWDDDPMPLLGHAITYRIAVGPHQGRKVRMLQTLPADDFAAPGADGPAGWRFSLHAGVAAKADRRNKLERLCRYVSRPPVSEKRLSLLPNGHLRYRLKTPYRNGNADVSGLWRCRQADRLHRSAGGDRQDSGSPGGAGAPPQGLFPERRAPPVGATG